MRQRAYVRAQRAWRCAILQVRHRWQRREARRPASSWERLIRRLLCSSLLVRCGLAFSQYCGTVLLSSFSYCS
ncbi:hypothetical protein DAI22_03g229800 [Oryza sativa Japonica Group]|nr:hypothetical protein DAI22_03g229800 [Oryza sativa Japonica Group]